MTTTCNGPIDINKSKSVKCNTRCIFTFKYKKSDTTVTPKTNYLSLTYKNEKSLSFNNTDYFVSEIRIYYKSIHTYDTKQSDAEIVVIHKTITGKTLLLCIPLVQSNLNTTAANKLNVIMTNLTKSTGTTSVDLKNFLDLDDFVKMSPFFTYKASSFLECSKEVDYIVYHPDDYNIAIAPSTYNTMMKLFAANTVYKPVTVFKDALSTPVLYYNSKGTAKMVDDEIYIDCQPVNKSEETVTLNDEVVREKTSFSKYKSNQFLQIFLCFVVFIIIMYISYYSIEITTAIFSFIKLPNFL